MKLYAIASSERASKGQGGNEYVNVEFYVHDRKVPIGSVELYLNDDTKDGYDVDEWTLTWRRGPEDEDTEAVMIAQGHAAPETKGKRQKGECRDCRDNCCLEHYHG